MSILGAVTVKKQEQTKMNNLSVFKNCPDLHGYKGEGVDARMELAS